jgi:ligand-binding sensor domain-containing protein
MQKWSSKNSNIFREGRELMRRFGGLATLALFVLFGPVPFRASAQQVASEYSHERWGREKGFPWGSVTAIAQSADGYLWVGTNRGLVRFDGDDDQIVPYADAALLSAKLVKNATLKIYKGFPHGMCTTNPEEINADLLAFFQRSQTASA